jgi:hypothetical protein
MGKIIEQNLHPDGSGYYYYPTDGNSDCRPRCRDRCRNHPITIWFSTIFRTTKHWIEPWITIERNPFLNHSTVIWSSIIFWMKNCLIELSKIILQDPLCFHHFCSGNYSIVIWSSIVLPTKNLRIEVSIIIQQSHCCGNHSTAMRSSVMYRTRKPSNQCECNNSTEPLLESFNCHTIFHQFLNDNYSNWSGHYDWTGR